MYCTSNVRLWQKWKTSAQQSQSIKIQIHFNWGGKCRIGLNENDEDGMSEKCC